MPLLGVSTLALALLYAAVALVLAVTLRRARRPPASMGADWPDVDVIVPARDEAEGLPATLASLAAQDYPGRLRVIVVDDRSRDDTALLVDAAAARDDRIRLVRVEAPSRRLAPKVNAVAHGVEAGSAPWIVTTDADCVHPRGWLRALLSAAGERDVLVTGHVETARHGEARGLFAKVEALDWVSLMLTNRALVLLGAAVVSTANNQAYRRAAFRAVGGFGAAGRAPSGDEDLLAQRLGALPGAGVAFADAPEARVLTASTRTWGGLLAQRRRWVSRYHHPQHYHRGFLAGIALLGAHSLCLSVATLTLPFWPAGLPWLLAAWGTVLAVVVSGMHVGLAGLGRDDLGGWPVWAWALLHPFLISAATLWSIVRPGSWRAGASAYRGRAWRAGLRRLWRRARSRLRLGARRQRRAPHTEA
jgi:cellulose synthase/poly-beta-1,6-N-acetylglucosamine synthase-like glycosyltransferase